MLAAGVVANVFTDFTDWLDDVSSKWWFLLVILAVAFFDSIVPIVPSETTVIIGGVAAGAGEQSLLLVIIAGACGAFLGDNTAYAIGRRFSDRIERRGERKPKTKARVEWATQQIRERGGLLLITARFIPGGRTILTITSGITRQPWVWFATWVAIAAVIWASYAATLGFIFGKSFADNHTVAFVLAFGAALSITVLIEVVRHVRSRRDEAEPDEDETRVVADRRS